jgi:hypothetical protein
MSLALSVLIALAIGLGIAWLLRPLACSGARELPLLLCLSLGLGLGATSLWFFLWLVIFGPHRNALIVGEIGILVALASLLLVRQRSKPIVVGVAIAPQERSSLWCIPAVAFVATLVAALTAFLRYTAAAPHGGWDAWGDWNLRARFLYLGGARWWDVFAPRGTLPHRDYPLLLSATVARCWTYMQNDAQRAPIVIAFLFTFANAAELLFALWLLRSRSQGLIAATVLLATPFFLVLGTAQYADVPFAFYFLSTIVLLCLHERSLVAGGRGLVLAGATAGLAAWTKDEGGLFLVCLLLSHFAITARGRGFAHYRRELASLLAGLLPVLAVVVFFKLRFAWHTDFVSSRGLVHRLHDASRYRVVFTSLGNAFLHFGAWSVSIPPLLIVYLLLVGRQRQEGQLAAKVGAATVGLTALGYLGVYLSTPLPLQWLLLTSLNRVCVQLYPSGLFVLFLVARTPEEALSRTIQ